MKDPVPYRRVMRHARRTSLYVVATGIAAVILTPLFFLGSLSLMSDLEAYNEWPLPAAPGWHVRRQLEDLGDRCRVAAFSRSAGEYLTLNESADPAELASFLRRKTNARLSTSDLAQRIAALPDGGSTRFVVRNKLLANYATFFRVTPEAVPALVRSVQTALATIALSLLFGGAAGYAFARFRFRGRHGLKLGVLFVRMFPAVAIAMPMVIVLGRVGLYDRPLGLSLVYAVGQMALTVWVTASVFAGIPVELEEAALVFGTSRAGAFRRVTLPLAFPGLCACAMYAFIGSWNETIQALVLTQFHPTFPVVVYQTLVGSKGMVNLAAAGGVTMALPAVVFAFFIRRYILTMWGAT